MSGLRSDIREMEESFAKFSLEDEEQGISYTEESTELSEIDTRWCLVGKFLTDSPIDFQAMQHKMASLWRPGKGMYVKQLDPNRFLFQFYHEVDIKRVCDGSPWTFGRFQLVFARLKEGDDPRTMVINNLELWVQLHGIGTGFMSQRVVTDIGNHIGIFVESDVNNFVGVWRDHFRVRVSIALDSPLKRRMKLKKSTTEWCWVYFKYEAVPTFCFICGVIGHSDKFCAKLFDVQGDEVEKPYGTWMRADPKRRSHTIGNKWLRSGGAGPVNNSGEEERDKSNPVKSAPATKITEKSGIGSSNGIMAIATAIQGANGGNQILSQQPIPPFTENNFIDEDNNSTDTEITLMNPKRKRLSQDSSKPNESLVSEFSTADMGDILQDADQNQKNLLLAATAMQSRHSP